MATPQSPQRASLQTQPPTPLSKRAFLVDLAAFRSILSVTHVRDWIRNLKSEVCYVKNSMPYLNEVSVTKPVTLFYESNYSST
eukprot:2068673-Amphidinium_carterae.1